MRTLELPPITGGRPQLDTVHHIDALTLLRALPDGSVDAVITDPPYGTTQCSWDTLFDLDALWSEVKRTLKPSGVAVFTSAQPFTSVLIMSNLAWFRCEWIWDKSPRVTGWLDAKRRPLRTHENILVFASTGDYPYFPVMVHGKAYAEKRTGKAAHYTKSRTSAAYNGDRYPVTVLKIPVERGLHPTQKPVALMEYLIRTYTQPGDLVVDPFCGSGTTLIAARNLGRHYIGCDKEIEYADVSKVRLMQPYGLPMFERELSA